MNTRFNFAFIRHLNTRRQGGMAMVFAIGMGAVVLVAAATMIIRAQGDQSKVVSSTNSTKADAIAEAGATRYMDFLNRNPVLLSAADHTAWATQWTSYLNGTIDGTGTPGSGTPQSGATCTDTNKDSVGNTINPSNPTGLTSTQITTSWSNPSSEQILSSSEKFKLVGYQYDSTTQTAAIGIQGIVGDGGSSPSRAASQMKFMFKVGQKQSIPASPSPSGNPIIPQTNPGLWARSFTGTDKQVAYANVLDSSDCGTGNTSYPQAKIGNLPSLPLTVGLPSGNHNLPLSNTLGTYTNSKIPFPPLPTYPTDWSSDPKHLERDPAAAADASKTWKVNQLSDCLRTSYPQNGDYDSEGNRYNSSSVPSTTKTYRYHVTAACSVPGVTFGSTGKETFVFYIDNSSFTISGDSTLASSAGNTAKVIWNLKQANLSAVGGNGQIGSLKTAQHWAFLLHGASNVGFQGGQDIYGFVFAPNGTYAPSTGSGGGNAKFAGTLWVNSVNFGNAQIDRISQALSQNDLNSIFTAAYTASGDTNYANYSPGGTPTTTNSVNGMTGFQKQAVSDSGTFLASALPGAKCNIPNLVNLNTTSEANVTTVKAAITANGFIAGAGTKTTATTGKTVTSQIPAYTAGAKEACGSTINFNYRQ